MKITKTTVYLILLVILALVLRLISAASVDIGTDEMIYSLIPLNIISAERLSTVEQAPLYFYLTDLGYKITGGLTLVSTRLPSIIFGSFVVLVLFLICRELFENKNIGLVAAFLFAVSGYALRFNQEMDMTAFFFSLVSILFFIQFLKGNNTKLIYLSALFLALGVLAKPIVLVFVPAYIIVFFLYGYTHHLGWFKDKEGKRAFNPQILKIILVAVVIAIIVVMPVLVYNYLLYKEKGITDYYFSVLAGVGNEKNIYQGQEAEPWSGSRLVTVSKNLSINFLRYDALLFILGLVGIPLVFKKEKYYSLLLVLSIVFLVLYLAGKMGSATHYVWIPLILSIFAGYSIILFQEKIRQHFHFRHFVTIIIILSLLSTGIVLQQIIPLKKTSIALALREYAYQEIPADAIVVLDPRIYRGIYAWAFNDRHYLEGTYFPELSNQLSTLPGSKENIPLYYIECGPGTNCGWKPEDFQRIYKYGEELSQVFHTQAQKIGEIKAVDTFIVYKGTITASPAVYEPIDRTHQHWYTPVGWKYPEDAIDTYTPRTMFDKLLNGVAFFILYADVAIALGSLGMVFYLLGKRSD